MGNILNIDTSSKICSVALAKDGEIVVGLESVEVMDHSTTLAPFVKQCLDYLKDKNEKLDAISVSIGPGSYTGLRIGLSMAKGIAFGQDIPLITLSSLEILTVRAIFNLTDFSGDELIIPMLDARRMEVYSAVFDSALNLIRPEMPIILEKTTYEDLGKNRRVLIIGDGSEKFKSLYKNENVVWMGNGLPHAKYMVTLSEKYYQNKRFSDIAYSVPNYLKEYQTTIPKDKMYL